LEQVPLRFFANKIKYLKYLTNLVIARRPTDGKTFIQTYKAGGAAQEQGGGKLGETGKDREE
jgi:hypothetical protein